VPLKHVPLAALFSLLCCRCAPAQISPGPLSHAHELLEGVTQCSSCHDFGAHTRSFKCLDCHLEIKHRLENHAGYHARGYQSSAGQTDCVRCHMEHNGQKFAMVRFDRKTFDHGTQTGFNLEGKHRALACEKCHTAKNISSSARGEIKVKDLNRSFLGLKRECISCHEDAHRGQEGTECARCHQPESWKSAPGFNHARTAFPLTGNHQTVACEKCHVPRPGEKATLFQGLPHNGCQNCHQDPHRGAFRDAKFQGSCENCHSTSGWKNSHPSAGFDHSRTNFKLIGKHAELACAKCHTDVDFHRPIAHDRCGACHEDRHKGQFASRVAGSDCVSCHNQTAFKPALFDREAHRRSAFPLEGKHVSVPCADCHPPAGPNTVFITRKLACAACHADQHAGQIAETNCDRCHTPEGFLPPAFSVARHAQTKFVLTGRHSSVACSGCHKPISTSSTAKPARQYHFTSQSCSTCHSDPHQTKFQCETCHSTEGWKNILAFDHSAAKFQLSGAHEKVNCTRCHSGPKPVFSAVLNQCSTCHTVNDPHGGQFQAGASVEDCSTCHVAVQWSTKIFNHDKARFALDVAHRNVACEKCHKEQKNAAGKMNRVYRGTPLECVKCH